ncbi:MAG: hypothetical protein ACD_5C00016G0017 [uncultured bacterium]|nr:MAG: hypothetical protein ACD_5C00016G0017 [uncultured bacterium]
MPNPYDKLYQKYGIQDAYSSSNAANDEEEERKRKERMQNGGKASDPYSRLYEKYQIKDDGSFASEEKKQEVQKGRDDYKIGQQKEQERKTEEERQANLNVIEKIAENPTVQKASNFALDTVKKINSWWDEASFKMNEQSLFNKGAQSTVVAENGRLVVTYPRIDAYKNATTEEEKQKIMQESEDANVSAKPMIKFLNSEAGKKTTGAISEATSDVPLKVIARAKAIGDDLMDGAYAAALKDLAEIGITDPNSGSENFQENYKKFNEYMSSNERSRFMRIVNGVQDGGVQSLIGVLTTAATSLANPAAGKAVGYTFFAAISAEGQRKEAGKVYSQGDIAIDTLGDMILAKFAEGALNGVLKEGASAFGNFLKSTSKGFATEGGTEVTQSFLKYANDWKSAKTDEKKATIVENVVNYVKSGGMIDEFLIGGISGAGALGLATLASKATNTKIDAEPSLQPKKSELGGNEEPEEVPAAKNSEVTGQFSEDFTKIRDEVIELQSKIGDFIDDEAQIERLTTLQDHLDDYHNAVKQRPIYIVDDIQEAPLAQVETVKYPDGKFAYRFSADTESLATGAAFSAETFTTKELATKAATAQLKVWAENELKNAEGKDVAQLNAILEQIDVASKPKEIKPVKENKDAVSDQGLDKLELELKELNTQKNEISRRGDLATSEEAMVKIDKEYNAVTARIVEIESQIKQGKNITKTDAENNFVNLTKKEAQQSQESEEKTVTKKIEEKPNKKTESILEILQNEEPKKEGETRMHSVIKGQKGQINYRDFGGWAELADESKTAKEFQEKLIAENLTDELKQFVKPKDKVVTSYELESIVRKVIINTFKRRTGMTFEEFYKNVKADSSQYESLANIGDNEIEKVLSGIEARELIRKVYTETNPEIAAMLQFELLEKIQLPPGANTRLKQLGWFDGKHLVGMARNMSRKQFIATLRHEIRHAAFSMMGKADQQLVIDWYKTLSKEELLQIFGKESLIHYESQYTGEELDKKMADEAANWVMDKNGKHSDSKVHAVYRKVIEAIAKMLNKINNKIFKKTAKRLKVQDLYDEVFSQKGGHRFARSKGYLAELEAKGFKAGKITNGDTGFSQRGISQSVVRDEKETSTRRFKTIVDKRKALLKQKNKIEKDFASSEQGAAIAEKVMLQANLAEDANLRVIQGIKNNTTFKKEGSISDAMGSGYLMEKNERTVVVESKNVQRYIDRGYERVIEIDSLAAEAGFEDGVSYLEHELTKKNPYSIETEQRKILQRSNSFYGKVIEELDKTEAELKEAKDSKGAFYLGMRIGSKTMKETYQKKMKTFSSRKEKVRAIKDFFALSENQFKKIGGRRDIQYMSEDEFQGFLKSMGQQAENETLRSQALELVMAQIKEKQLQKYDNLRMAMKLPPMEKMSTQQLQDFDKALEDSQMGDEFFTQRQLETVKNTELKGIKTVREAREKLAERIGMSIESLGNIKVSPTLDAMRYDTAFAEANPFYRLVVEETNIATLNAEARFLEIEHEANKLIKAARKSRKRSLADRIAPKDELIFSYLESADKTEIAKDMTNEELEAAEFIRRSYEQMRDYLIANDMMDKYREDYITHIRRGFLETWRGDGFITAVKEIFVQQQEDAAAFRILQGDTRDVLPLEKFFQFTLKRTGGLIPTQNVAAAFLAYTKSFEKKRALDSLIPKLDVYVYAISPKEETPKGLLMDRTLKKMLNEWINNKKGRKIDLGGKLPQGGKVDTTIRAFVGLTSILDLGLSIPAGVITNIGEQSQNVKMLGPKNYAIGLSRLATRRGRNIIKEYRNFVGKNPWGEIAEASNTLGDSFLKTTFVLFKDANIRANKIFLLSAMTKEEFAAGKISTERLADMKIDMGRFRAVEGAKSILGSTSLGSAVNQYKGWAIPILRTTIKDAKTLSTNIRKEGIKALHSREGWELFYTLTVEGGLGMLLLSLFSSDKDKEKEKTFAEKIIDKGIRDVMSGVGAMDPKFFVSVPRVLAFLTTISNAASQIVHWEQYSQDAPDGSYQEGDLKGVKNLEKTVTPAAVKQFIPSSTTDADKRNEMIKDQVEAGKDPYKIADDVAKELGYDQNADDYKTKWGKIKNDAMREGVVQKTGKQTERLAKARLKTAKMKILKEYKADMPAVEFKAYLETLYEGKVISKAVYDEF